MKVSALDESGKAVDWFFLYKVPKLVKGANSDEATGYEYVYSMAKLGPRQGAHYRGKLMAPLNIPKKPIQLARVKAKSQPAKKKK